MKKKLHSDFKFGFELEGFADLEKYMPSFDSVNEDNDNCYGDFEAWCELPCNGLYKEHYDKFYTAVNNKISSELHNSSGRTHYDGSLKNYADGWQSFEYSSPIYDYIPYNVNTVKKFLKNLPRLHMGTNDTCGFHTHISFPSITENEAIWIICYIASNKEYIDEFCKFVYGPKEEDSIEFYSNRYASKEYLLEINNAFASKDINKIKFYISSREKYRLIRIHPQGTLEWRGPRRFLEIENGVDLFFNKLNKIINIMCEALNTNYICGFSKQEIFNSLISNKKTFNWNGLEINVKSNIAKRIGSYGIVEKFNGPRNKYDRQRDTYEISSRIVKIILNNNIKLLVSNKFDHLLPTIISILNNDGNLTKIFDKLQSKNIKIPYLVQKLSVYTNAKIAAYLDKNYFNNVMKSDINFLLDVALIQNESAFDKNTLNKIVNNILTNCKIEYFEDVIMKLATTKSIYIKNIIEILSTRNDLQMISVKDFYNVCIDYNYFNFNTTSTMPYSLNEIHTILKNLMIENKIKNIIITEEFPEEYSELNELDIKENIFSIEELCQNYELNSIRYETVETPRIYYDEDTSENTIHSVNINNTVETTLSSINLNDIEEYLDF